MVAVASVGIGVLFLIMVVSLLALAARVLFALAAYNDACAKANPDALMWGLLVGFLGLIPGIIYLCIRNSSRNYIMCPNCGFRHYFYDAVCPRCGAPNQPPQNRNPLAGEQVRRAKLFLTIAVALTGVALLAVIVCMVFVVSISSFGGNSFYY
jgi:Oxygen-sensitive ribonucleoside-triphosphate reductase